MCEQLTVLQVMNKAIESMTAMGLKPNTVWAYFYSRCMNIVHFYADKGLEYYDPKVTAEYLDALKIRLDKCELCNENYRNYRKTAERMDEVFLTGRIQWSCKSRHKREALNQYFSSLHDEYLNTNKFHPNTREDISWAVYKHLFWLLKEGYEDFGNVTENDISRYISYCARKVCPGSLRNLISYTRMFYSFIATKGETSIAYQGFLTTSIRRPEKIQTASTQEEVTMVLTQINRATPLGKRDYAAILLGARMGIRASDIVCLKLQDINWKENQIRIIQQKTGTTLLLPMPLDVQMALKEYILNARPKSEYKQVFLRAHAPVQPLNAGSALGYTYHKYQKKAGIKRNPFDGKGFHSLRRMLGKEMTIAGVPVTTVAQVLGHRNFNTAKQYISLDTVHLKECALDLRGIEIAGGVF